MEKCGKLGQNVAQSNQQNPLLLTMGQYVQATFLKPVRLTLMTGSRTTIDSLRSVWPIIDRMNQHLLDNVKKSVGQEGIRVKFVGTEDNLADPLTKRITDHEGLRWLCRIDQ